MKDEKPPQISFINFMNDVSRIIKIHKFRKTDQMSRAINLA